MHGVPASIRYGLGAVDILFAALLTLGIRTRLCALIFLPLMLGGVFADFKNGFSYRHQGYEVHLAYSLIALALLLDKPARPRSDGFELGLKPGDERLGLLARDLERRARD